MQTHIKLVIFLFVPFVVDGKKFQFGRSKHGNLGEPAGYNGEPLPPEQWFTQKLDHFRPTDLHTWRQRYFVNDSFYDFNNPGPVFLMIGGEGPANPKWMVKGAWIEYAKKFKALCINLEHRYYGKSHPTKDLGTKNLQYLSSSQALADLANFIGAMNIKFRLRKDVKWIAFGGSYPGSLAAWLRLKYPHLVYGAVSSSGPLLAKVNFIEYYEVVVEALREKTGDELCVEQLKAAHNQVVAMIKTKPDVVEKEFKLCKPLKDASELDIRNFYSSIADEFADLVQYNDDNRITAGAGAGAGRTARHIDINSVCDLLTEPSSVSALHRLAEFSALMLAESNETCLDYSYDNMIKTLTNTSHSSGDESEGGRQWLYQTCTEFGFYQTSSAEPEVFGDMLTLDFFVQQCKDVFGHKFDREFIGAAAQWTNLAYGALDNAARRVVYVHGSVDPWHALGITATMDGDSPAIYIRGTAHCADMYPSSPEDPSELVMARVQIMQYLDQWVG